MDGTTLQDISRLLVHLLHPEIFTALGVTPTQGLLLHGPPGCGELLLVSLVEYLTVPSAVCLMTVLRNLPYSKNGAYFFLICLNVVDPAQFNR